MKLKWGALAVDGRGKIGGQVAARNRSGAYLRNKVTPNNPNTGFQQSARTALAGLSSAWKNLTEAQRDAWNAAVGSWENTNVFGDNVIPTGKNLFTQLNIVRRNLGGGLLNTPPEKGSLPQISEVEVEYDVGAGNTMTVGWTHISGDGEGIIMATAPVSAGVSYVERKYRRLSNIADISTESANIKSDYEDRFGAATEGQKVFVKVVPALEATGQKGTGSSASTIVVST